MVDPLGDYATLGGAIATAGLLGAAIVAGVKAAGDIRKQIDMQRAIQRKQRVFELQGAFSSREFTEMSAVAADVIELFRSNRSAAVTTWEHRISRQEAMTALAVLNYYELVAAEYNAESFDRATADSYMGYAAVIMWEYAEPFTDYLREKDSTFFVEWKYFFEHYGDKVISAARRHYTDATRRGQERDAASDRAAANPHDHGRVHGTAAAPTNRQASITAIDELLASCQAISSEVSALRSIGATVTAEQRSRLENNLHLASAKSHRLEPSRLRAEIHMAIRTAEVDITAAEAPPDIVARLAVTVADVEKHAKALKAR